ncbi:MAG: hypothetical protein ACK56I_07455, partial [bacterium]
VARRAGRRPNAKATGRRALRKSVVAKSCRARPAGAPKACPPPAGRARPSSATLVPLARWHHAPDFVMTPKSCGSHSPAPCTTPPPCSRSVGETHASG